VWLGEQYTHCHHSTCLRRALRGESPMALFSTTSLCNDSHTLQTAEMERLVAAAAVVSVTDIQSRIQRSPSQRSQLYEGSRRSSMYSEGDGASTSRATSRRSMSPTDSRRVSVSSPSLAESDVVKLRKVRSNTDSHARMCACVFVHNMLLPCVAHTHIEIVH
jgi:hypothetical protein